MRRFIAIFGTLLIAMILLSGPAVAQSWHYIEFVDSATYCTDPSNAIGEPDGVYGTVGQNNPPKLGDLVLDLSEANLMGPNQDFIIYHESNINETYNISVITDDRSTESIAWPGWDTEDLTFTTPSTEAVMWRYIHIVATYGLTNVSETEDTIYGPDVDAIGWYG